MGLGLVVVEVCTRNDMSQLDLEALEEKYPEIAVMRTDCLNNCNLCRARPYAYVNEQRIFEKTKEECLVSIEKAIQEELKEFYEYD